MPDPHDQSPKLLDRARQTCRRRQYRYHTEKAYVRWVIHFVRFHDTTHPRHLDEDDIRAFLNHLASHRGAAAFTQNQALNVLVFFYEQLRTTMQYVHVLEQSGDGITSPLNTLSLE